MLLYAKTGNESIGWNRFIIDGNIIVITDLDLNTSFDKIEEKLCDIIDWYHNKIDDQYMSEKYG